MTDDQIKKIEVRSKRLGLPLSDGVIMWTREDAITHIQPWDDDKCEVAFSVPHYSLEKSDGTMTYRSAITVHAPASEVLRACYEAQDGLK